MGPRYELILRTGDRVERIAVPPADGSLVVGRDVSCDVRIGDPDVSRRHCSILARDGAVILRPESTRLPTLVNGEIVSGHRPLHRRDRVSIGTSELVLVAVGESDAGALEVVRTFGEASRGLGTVEMGPESATTAAEPEAYAFSASTVILGRDAGCDVVVDDLTVSRKHAAVRQSGGRWILQDLGSTNGCFVNGEAVGSSRPLEPGDVIGIGRFRYAFTPGRLVPVIAEPGVRIDVRDLSQVGVERGRRKVYLDSVSLTIMPREFVGILGRSGCGKSTFMEALNGRRPPTSGSVLLDGVDMYRNFGRLKEGIGFIPQEVVIHDALPVRRALEYASRLRLAGDLARSELDENIERVLQTVGLQEHGDKRVSRLSGGQKKRVSIAVELLSRPRVLFLDEVTSGLDSATEHEMMLLFKNLAADGLTTMCITHHLDSLSMCDMLAYFIRGRLAFYGPTRELMENFGIGELSELYGTDTRMEPDAWAERFHAHRCHAVHVTGRAMTLREPVSDSAGAARPPLRDRIGESLRQGRTLLRRQVRLMLASAWTLALTVGLGPIVGLLLLLRFSGTRSSSADAVSGDRGSDGRRSIETGAIADILSLGDGAGNRGSVSPEMARSLEIQLQTATDAGLVGMYATLSILFLGVFAAVREIVKERSIYRHERFARLRIGPYLASKIVPLLAIVSVHAASFVLFVDVLGDRSPAGQGTAGVEWAFLASAFSIYLVTGIAGAMLGLAISAWARTSDQAITFMILAIIPQFLFVGALDRTYDGLPRWIARIATTEYWSYRAYLQTVDPSSRDLLDADSDSEDETAEGEVAAEEADDWWSRMATPEWMDPPGLGWAPALMVVAGHGVLFTIAGAWLLRRQDPRASRSAS